MNLDDKKLLVFIPAYNEEGSVGTVIEDVKKEFGEGVEVLVVDDGSTDRTHQISEKAGATVVSFPFNQGSGAASQTGYLYAWQNGFEYVGQLDADGQHRAEDLKMIISKVIEGDADLAVGSRYLDPDYDSPDAYEPSFLRGLGSKIFRKMLAISGGQKLTDVTSGLRATDRKVVEQFADVYDPDYAEIESLQRCLNIGLRVKEYQVTMLPRQAGETKIKTIASINYALKTFLILGVGALRKSRDKELYQQKNPVFAGEEVEVKE